VVLAHAASKARVHWRLTRHGKTVAHGAARARHGRLRLRLNDFGRLRTGRYTLRIAGLGSVR
jgi:hypothetical protein